MIPTINIFTENIYDKWELDEKELIDNANVYLDYYLSTPEIYNNSCLHNQNFDTLVFDILYCDSEKTHTMNRDYRDKDYPADIITFAIFADSADDEKFIFDGEINLGEIIIALDKVEKNAQEKGWTRERELNFLIAHGIMHLLGFDHQTEEEYNFVVNAQEQALSKIKGF
ncbi:rRNA maturation RNase YbeY [bacterium]|nr:rRNA maturation RNase YbeY [bacterium]